ncbi:peptidoglycan-binding protein, partial [uncultured Marinococcus sp.]|uniref:peptidoglycan-binding domain-containing protein n=1 Tax=uncultured Marinococcus sp. TaxID=487012 RepID=UPI0026250D3E
MVSSKKIIFFSSFIVSISLGSLATTGNTVLANEEDNHNEFYMAEGTEASEVKELEEALIVLGYPLQEADTLFDSSTSIHISDYQERNSFEVTGEVDQELLESILEDMKSAKENEASGNTESENQIEKDSSIEEAYTASSNSENEVEDESRETSAGTEESDADSSFAQRNDEAGQIPDSDDRDLKQEESDEDESTAEEPQDMEVDEEETMTQDVKSDADEEKEEDENTKQTKAPDADEKVSIEQEEAAPQKARSFVLAANTFSASAVSSSMLLKDGVTSPAARAMKEDLYTLGYLDIANPNERFGPQTAAAVKDFQRDHGLVVDGVAGPNTLAKIS